MAVSAGDILEVAMVHVYQDVNECINVYHFQSNGVGSSNDEDVDGDLKEFLGSCYEMIDAHMGTEVDIKEIRWRNLTDDGPTRYVPWTGTYTGGTSGAQSLPPGNAFLILWRTGVKRVVGRTYLPPFTESTQSGGIWGSGEVGSVGAFATALATPWTGADTGAEYHLRVWSKRLAAPVSIVGPYASPVVAYMRRRRQGRGS